MIADVISQCSNFMFLLAASAKRKRIVFFIGCLSTDFFRVVNA